MTPEQKKELIELVKIEAKNLREKATKEELDKLKISELNTIMASACIYGQMTGWCYSDRADFLIKQCTEKVYDGQTGVNRSEEFVDMDTKRFYYWSPIEVYIAQDLPQNANLIDYLKGKTNKLEL